MSNCSWRSMIMTYEPLCFSNIITQLSEVFLLALDQKSLADQSTEESCRPIPIYSSFAHKRSERRNIEILLGWARYIEKEKGIID